MLCQERHIGLFLAGEEVFLHADVSGQNLVLLVWDYITTSRYVRNIARLITDNIQSTIAFQAALS